MNNRHPHITAEHGVGEAELQHVRATYVTRENLRQAITAVVNATLEARDLAWWGEATSTASDSKRFASWDSSQRRAHESDRAGHCRGRQVRRVGSGG